MAASPSEEVTVVFKILTNLIRLLRVDEIIRASQKFRTILIILADMMMWHI